MTDDPAASRLARFEELFNHHRRAVLAYALRRADSIADAEDAAADTFAICWRKLDAIPAEDPILWLYAVCRKVLANQRRGRGRRERLAAALHRSHDLPTPLHLGEELDGPAFQALASLSPADQELLRLVAWEELRNPQIAQVLGITPNAVAIRLHRARARFAAALKELAPSRTSVDVRGTKRAAWKGEAP